MYTISLVSRKGGTGKSTLAAHLSVEAAKRHSTGIIDTDPQGTLTGWWNDRQADVPAYFPAVSRATGDILIIDTPPSTGIKAIIKDADLCLIPVKPSPNDLRAVGDTVTLVETMGVPLIFVICMAQPRAKLTGEAAIALSQHGEVCPTIIHNRVDYARAMIDGRVAGELHPTGRAAEEITSLWKYVYGQIRK